MQRQMNRLYDQMTNYNSGSQSDGDRIDSMMIMPTAEVHETPDEVKF